MGERRPKGKHLLPIAGGTQNDEVSCFPFGRWSYPQRPNGCVSYHAVHNCFSERTPKGKKTLRLPRRRNVTTKALSWILATLE